MTLLGVVKKKEPLFDEFLKELMVLFSPVRHAAFFSSQQRRWVWCGSAPVGVGLQTSLYHNTVCPTTRVLCLKPRRAEDCGVEKSLRERNWQKSCLKSKKEKKNPPLQTPKLVILDGNISLYKHRRPSLYAGVQSSQTLIDDAIRWHFLDLAHWLCIKS